MFYRMLQVNERRVLQTLVKGMKKSIKTTPILNKKKTIKFYSAIIRAGKQSITFN